MPLSEQMSVRLTTEQRDFIRARLETLRTTQGVTKASEADVVRAYIQYAVDVELYPMPSSNKEAK